MNTNNKFVITISREVGSGGRTIGRKLAQRLDVRFCDKQLIRQLMDKFGLDEDEIEKIKGQKQHWLLDIFSKVSPDFGTPVLTPKEGNVDIDVTPDRIYHCEREILTSLAKESSCVIAGRSGFFVLKSHPNKLDVFIRASLEHRIARIMKKQRLTEQQAADLIEKIDKARENYIQRYASVSRYDLRNYDLILNTDHLTDDTAVEVILKAIGQV